MTDRVVRVGGVNLRIVQFCIYCLLYEVIALLSTRPPIRRIDEIASWTRLVEQTWRSVHRARTSRTVTQPMDNAGRTLAVK